METLCSKAGGWTCGVHPHDLPAQEAARRAQGPSRGPCCTTTPPSDLILTPDRAPWAHRGESWELLPRGAEHGRCPGGAARPEGATVSLTRGRGVGRTKKEAAALNSAPLVWRKLVHSRTGARLSVRTASCSALGRTSLPPKLGWASSPDGRWSCRRSGLVRCRAGPPGTLSQADSPLPPMLFFLPL